MEQLSSIPIWMTEDGYKMFSDKYLYDCVGPKEQWERISSVLSSHTPYPEFWADKFFDIMYRGAYSCSTPCLANTGTNRGLPVSCSGNYIGDSVYEFFDARLENALLSKHGHGTSSFLGDIRPRGSVISTGGVASGVITEMVAQRAIAQEISQGYTRRGSWAGYLPIEHKDFWELWNFLNKYPDDTNIGWNISDNFIDGIKNGNKEYDLRWQSVLYLRAKYGRGYLFFPDKVNRRRPEWMKRAGAVVHASNLCTEITLPSSNKYTFSCVLGAINLCCDKLSLEDDVFTATVLLDCLVSEYLLLIKNKPGFGKIYQFTKDFRAIGLGVMGFHSFVQKKEQPLDSFQTHLTNKKLFRTINDSSKKASEYLARKLGVSDYMWENGAGLVRNSHRIAMMPTVSTSEIMGGWSEGINPMITNVASKTLANGERFYVNPVFNDFLSSCSLKEDTAVVLSRIAKNGGSVKDECWMTGQQKRLFRTAFEYSQRDLLRLASGRQEFICQAQSINLHFSKNEKESVISDMHRDAALDENILSLYYMRSADSEAVGDVCELCQ